ncbi:MAG: L-seryl-tRNA(Ser) seleniumtransferase [Acidimicrobiaceae bacterium]|nr:L-seryl-tRNA(Ser) seleniumtransferase [Acidimicrobiaceae bacterium]
MVNDGDGGRPPSVDALARSLAESGLPHPVLVEVARAAIAAGDPGSAPLRAEEVSRSLLRPVINATGVLLHTNLGRAPLRVRQDAHAWNLEFDLSTGRRGSRGVHAAALLARAAGAADALVTNNGAAAVLLVLTAMAAGRTVIVSRGELVEIGGGFRIPEVLAMSGATLVEVGTTNRTRLADYEAALHAHPDVAVVLKVHQSNYRMVGFTESVPVGELAKLGVPVVVDIGSGLLDADTPWIGGGPPAWLADEPAARQTLAAGATIVTFSGDKLLGGPQAGIIAGSTDAVAACARHPLSRALRPGALVLGALQETALAYLRRDGGSIPFWRMATASVAELRARASAIAVASDSEVVACASVAGGGSLPGLEIPSVGVSLTGDFARALRAGGPPVIARVESGRTICDVRSVDPDDDGALASAILAARHEP